MDNMVREGFNVSVVLGMREVQIYGKNERESSPGRQCYRATILVGSSGT